MKRDAILCMLSGGLRSTGALHALITDSHYRNRDLFIHHVILQNRENRAQAELAASATIVDYYHRKYPARPFTYTESIFNTMGFAPFKSEQFPEAIDICAYLGAHAAIACKEIREVAFGLTTLDLEKDTTRKLNLERAQRTLKNVYSLERSAPPKVIFPIINADQQTIWQSLPAKVQQAVWHCQQPSYQADGAAAPCENCSACNDANQLD